MPDVSKMIENLKNVPLSFDISLGFALMVVEQKTLSFGKICDCVCFYCYFFEKRRSVQKLGLAFVICNY